MSLNITLPSLGLLKITLLTFEIDVVACLLYKFFLIHVFSDYEPPSGWQMKQKFCSSYTIGKKRHFIFKCLADEIFIAKFFNYQTIST